VGVSGAAAPDTPTFVLSPLLFDGDRVDQGLQLVG